MKLVIAQMMFPKGHRLLDEKFVKLITKFAEVIIIDDGKYFDLNKLPKEKITRFVIHPFFSPRIEVVKKFLHFINILQILFIITKLHLNDVVFLSIHPSIYTWIGWMSKSLNITLIHHYDIDRTLSNTKSIRLFNKCANKVKHIVLAGFIKEGLLKHTTVKSENIFVVDQPFIHDFDLTGVLQGHNNNVIIAMGSNNDTQIVEQIIRYDKENPDINLKNKIILRHNRIKYIGHNVEVLNGYLDREAFDNYLQNYKACIVIYSESYKYRYSGIIDDALVHGMIVISNNILVGRYYNKKYPSNCYLFNKIDELFRLANQEIPRVNEKELLEFANSHSDMNVLNQLKTVFVNNN